MPFWRPPHILKAKLGSQDLRFTWDDWKAEDLYEYDSSEIAQKLMRLTIRAQIAIGIGIYEWIMWRLQDASETDVPRHLAEAARCGMVDPRYMKYVELPRREWMGPVHGPLWCAVTWMVPMVFHEEMGEVELESGLEYLPSLAMHVVPEPELFENWLHVIADRLLQHYEAEEADPFEDLFGDEDRAGKVVPREALDPDFDFRPEDGDSLMEAYLKSVDHQGNPFLRSPQEMLAEGFDKTPYRL